MAVRLSPAEGLVIRAGMYQVLAMAFAYPDDRYCERATGLAAGLAEWVGLLHPAWADRLRRLRDALAEAPPDELEAEFNRLFSGAMACTPHETAYEPDVFRKQHALADIAGFYRAWGFQLPEASRWPLDHAGVELEFCAILLQRMAGALDRGLDEQAALCQDALRKFLADHLGRWSAAFGGSLAQGARTEVYRVLAALTREWVEAELAAMGLEPDRLMARKTYRDDADAPVCGACTACGPAGPPAPGACPTPPA